MQGRLVFLIPVESQPFSTHRLIGIHASTEDLLHFAASFIAFGW